MKKLIILIIMSMFLVPLAIAGELEDLNWQRNQINVAVLQLQAQDQLLVSQLDAYATKYVADRADLASRVDRLVKQGRALDKQIKALEDATSEPEVKE